MSKPFNVGNRVHQGGVLSPQVFNMFIDELSLRLSTTDVGFLMNDVSSNHMSHADDAVISAPTLGALSDLKNICTRSASDIDMKYNVKKKLHLMMFHGPKTKILNHSEL